MISVINVINLIYKMIKIIIISILFFVSAAFSTHAQRGYDAVLQQIEVNNTTLAALRKQTDADKIGNRTGLTPVNPEVEFNYLWGNPALIGNRTDISVRQTFDFPTAYAHRNRIAGLQNENAELAYKVERINVLLLAKQTCIELVYFNALAKEYAARLQNAERIAAAYKAKWDAGEVSILEHKKAQLNLSTVQADVARIDVETRRATSLLKQLNGGEEITFHDTDLPPSPAERGWGRGFEDWYATAETKSPVLQYISGQIEISRQQVKLNQALGLPKFSAGYMSEKVVGQHFQGVTLGASIPLWENKNRVNYARAQIQAAELALEDNKVQFYNRLQSHHLKAVALQQNAQKLRQSLSDYGNEPLLKKALDAGEISLLNYLLEIEYYYDVMNKVLEAERDFEMAAAELWAVEI